MTTLDTLLAPLARQPGTPLQRMLRDIDPTAHVILGRSRVAEFCEGEDGFSFEPCCFICYRNFYPTKLLISRDHREPSTVSYTVAVVVYSVPDRSIDFLNDGEPEGPCCWRCWADVERALKESGK